MRPITELLELNPTEWTSDEAGFVWGYAVGFAEEVLDESAKLPLELQLQSKARAFGLLLAVAAVILPHVPGTLWTWAEVKPSLVLYNEVVEQRLARQKLSLPGLN